MSVKSGNSAVRTAEDYIFGCVNFEIPSEAALSILAGRNHDADEPISGIDTNERELLKADLYMWIVMGPSKVNSTSDSDNGWSHSGGGYSFSEEDKERMLNYAYAIYDKYDEENPFDDRVHIDISSHGIMHCDYDISGNPLPHTVGF